MLTWHGHTARSLLLQHFVQHQLQDVGKVGEAGEAASYLQSMAAETACREEEREWKRDVQLTMYTIDSMSQHSTYPIESRED